MLHTTFRFEYTSPETKNRSGNTLNYFGLYLKNFWVDDCRVLCDSLLSVLHSVVKILDVVWGLFCGILVNDPWE